MTVEQYEIEWLQEQIYNLEDTIRELEGRIAKLEQEKLPLVPIPTPWPDPVPDLYGGTQCPKCGLVWSGVMGYVCPDSQCPIQLKVTC